MGSQNSTRFPAASAPRRNKISGGASLSHEVEVPKKEGIVLWNQLDLRTTTRPSTNSKMRTKTNRIRCLSASGRQQRLRAIECEMQAERTRGPAGCGG